MKDDEQKARELIDAVGQEFDPARYRYVERPPITRGAPGSYWLGLVLAFGGLLAAFATGVELFWLVTALGVAVFALALYRHQQDLRR